MFDSYPIAIRWYSRQEKKKNGWKPRCIGMVHMHDTGRPAKVYCNYRPRYVDHEVKLTEELIDWNIPMLDWKRSIMTDSELRPDAQYKNLMIEYDNGTEKRPQVMQQAKRYRDKDVICVWVFQTTTRFDWIQKVADKGNTLVKLAGASEVYSLDGKTTSIEGVVNLVTNSGL